MKILGLFTVLLILVPCLQAYKLTNNSGRNVIIRLHRETVKVIKNGKSISLTTLVKFDGKARLVLQKKKTRISWRVSDVCDWLAIDDHIITKDGELMVEVVPVV